MKNYPPPTPGEFIYAEDGELLDVRGGVDVEIADAAEYQAKYGLTARRTVSLPGARTAVVVTASAPPPPSAPTQPAGLAAIIANLHKRALAAPGQGAAATLPRGLRIDLRVQAGQVTLLISRPAPKYPSLKEWSTVVNHFPYNPPDAHASDAFEHAGRWWIRSTWPLPPTFEPENKNP